jgi:hypothetical protein
MGEMAEDRRDGTACSLCGQYFQDPKDIDALYTHGEPAVCWSCWTELKPEEKKLYKRAKVDTI